MSTTLELYADIRRRFPPSKQMLPPTVNSALTAWWLALGFTLVGLAALWPMLARGLVGMIGVDFLVEAKSQELTAAAWYFLGAFAVAMILLGLLLTMTVVKKSRLGLTLFRLSFVVGLLFGLALAGGVIYLLMGDSPRPQVRPSGAGSPAPAASAAPASPLGPAPYLAGTLLAITGLTPIFFGILGLTLSGSKMMREYFETTDADAFAPVTPSEEAAAAEASAGVAVEETAEEPATTTASRITPMSPDEARAVAGLEDSARAAATALDAVLAEEGIDAGPGEAVADDEAAALDAILAEEGVAIAEEAGADDHTRETAADAVTEAPADRADDPKRTMLAPKPVVDDADEVLLAEAAEGAENALPASRPNRKPNAKDPSDKKKT
jgi:hypothetical protein